MEGGHHVSYTDVKDNSKLLSESFLLAPMAAVAEEDDHIPELFNQAALNSVGIISTEVYVRGLPTQVAVDDFLPFISGTRNLAFAQRSSTGSFWSPYLEKAYAKVMGNYESISDFYFGQAADGFSFLLGVPTETHLVQDFC